MEGERGVVEWGDGVKEELTTCRLVKGLTWEDKLQVSR